MDFTANRLELLSAAQDVQKIIPRITVLEMLQCAYLKTEDEKLTVAGCSSELALERRICADIREDGCTVIDAALLVSILRVINSETVTLQREATGVLTISGGTAEYRLSVPDASTYPRTEIPVPEKSVAVCGLPTLVMRSSFAAADQDVSASLNCLNLQFSDAGLRAIGSDGFRIAVAKGDSKAVGQEHLLIPAPLLEKLAHLVENKDVLQIGTVGKRMVCRKEDFAFSARLVEGGYFDADQLMNSIKPVFTVLTDADGLRKALSTAYSVTGTQNRFSLAFNGARLLMRCESECGASCAEVEVIPLSGNPDGTFWYNAAKLLDCLRAQKGTLMLELAQNGALIMRTDELTCVQMAIREPKAIMLEQKKQEKKATAKRAA